MGWLAFFAGGFLGVFRHGANTINVKGLYMWLDGQTGCNKRTGLQIVPCQLCRRCVTVGKLFVESQGW
jgi:hypothetical protein